MGQTWPRIVPATGGGGTGGFPDASFGTPHDDDEEWDGAATFVERGWTVTDDTYASGDVALNSTFAPSRVTWTQPQSSGARLWIAERTLTDAGGAANLSVTFDLTGSDRTNHTSAIEIGFLRSGSFLATTATIQSGNTEIAAIVRQWTAKSTPVNVTSVIYGQAGGPGRYYVHLQYIYNTGYQAFFSSDAVNWQAFPLVSMTATSVEYDKLWIRVNHSAFTGGRYQRIANNWIRVNRFFL